MPTYNTFHPLRDLSHIFRRENWDQLLGNRIYNPATGTRQPKTRDPPIRCPQSRRPPQWVNWVILAYPREDVEEIGPKGKKE